MKISLGAYLGLSYLALILISIGCVIPLAWLAAERLYLNTQSANLLAQAQLIAAALHTQALQTDSSTPYSQLSNALPGIHTRVIDTQGAVVIDFSTPGQLSTPGTLAMPQLAQNASGSITPEELISRPEIAKAKTGQPTTAIRRVAVAGGKRVLYAAAPVLSSDGNVTSLVYLATPLPDTQWTALPVTIRWQLTGVILLAILFASVAGFLLARRISRPLEKLADAAHSISAGDLGRTAPERQIISEMAVLGHAFNHMTGSLRQADQAKTAFISDISHELRTPLTVLKGTIETLEDGAIDDLEARASFLAAMSQETERMIRLVNDLLVLTRADAGALDLQRSLLDLQELARSRCDYLQKTANQRQVRLCVEAVAQSSEQNPFPVFADPDRIAQVLDNLLDNSIRYAPDGSAVVITLLRKESQVICQVTDTGAGIPARHLPLIFERFYQVDPARKHSQGSGGLGLSIVRSLVQAHGGDVSAISTENQGTTVTFWLPAAN